MIRQVYLNAKQRAFVLSRKKVRAFIGGRGSGKSHVLGAIAQQSVQTMPRSRGAIVSDTDETISNRSLPSVIEYWDGIGWQEGEDYVIGKKPPDHFDRPYNKVTKFPNVISFANGASMDMVSLYNKRKGRGANYQWVLVDEAALVDRGTYLTNILPAIRGNYHRVARIPLPQPVEVPYGRVVDDGGLFWEVPFRENPYYATVNLVSSMPWTTDGMWLLDFEEDPDAFYIEATARDNEAVLGPDYMERMRQQLPELVYLVEVENHRLGQVPNGFYADWDDVKHTVRENPYRPDLGLMISFDFNAGFNSLIVAQEYDGVLWVVDEMWVKGNQIVDDLVVKFMTRYKGHPHKAVEIYGDRNGNSRHANSKKTIYESVEEVLSRNGWRYYRPGKGLDAPHAVKHQMINQALKEDGTHRLPKVRVAKRCKGLIISISTAPITEDFKKDKLSERRSTVASEHATHLSDCFDNLYVFAYRHRWSSGASESGGIFLG